MCGRFLFSDGHNKTILEIKEEVQKKYKEISLPFEEVTPGTNSIVLIEENNALVPVIMHWGIQRKDKKVLMINARLENIMQNTFADDYKHRRCIIPASGFFEWDKNRKKHYISAHSNEALFMAGIYRSDINGNSYCIITKEATEALKTIHNRMPVLLSYQQALDYCLKVKAAD